MAKCWRMASCGVLERWYKYWRNGGWSIGKILKVLADAGEAAGCWRGHDVNGKVMQVMEERSTLEKEQ